MSDKFIIEYKFRASSDFCGGWAMLVSGTFGPSSIAIENQVYSYNDLLKKAVKWDSEEAAHRFMKEFEGYPWYHKRRLNGKYVVKKVPVKKCQCMKPDWPCCEIITDEFTT